MNRALGFFYVILAGVGFGFIGIFSRIAFRSGISVGELLTWRFSLAALILWTILLLARPRLVRLSLQQILVCLALGTFGYAVFSSLYFSAIQGVSVPLAALLLFTFPIWVSLGSHFILKDRMSRVELLSLLIACVGLGILLWGPMFVSSKAAVLYGLGSGITYAIYVLVSGRVQKNVQPLSSSLYVITAAALTFLAIHRPSFHHLQEMTLTQISCIAGLAIFSTIGPLTFFLAGLQRLPSTQASVIVMVEPVVAALAAGLFLSETLTNFQLVGAGLVLLALVLNALKKK